MNIPKDQLRTALVSSMDRLQEVYGLKEALYHDYTHKDRTKAWQRIMNTMDAYDRAMGDRHEE